MIRSGWVTAILLGADVRSPDHRSHDSGFPILGVDVDLPQSDGGGPLVRARHHFEIGVLPILICYPAGNTESRGVETEESDANVLRKGDDHGIVGPTIDHPVDTSM